MVKRKRKRKRKRKKKKPKKIHSKTQNQFKANILKSPTIKPNILKNLIIININTNNKNHFQINSIQQITNNLLTTITHS
jgi:hypothetical protein